MLRGDTMHRPGMAVLFFNPPVREWLGSIGRKHLVKVIQESTAITI